MCRGRCENMQNTRDVEGGFFFEGLESKKQNLKMNEIFYRNPDVEGQE